MTKKYRTLIIDDEPMAREILENHLSKIDAIDVIASCSSATKGFSVLSAEEVDLILLDINMPEVTGLMFAKAVQGSATKIIFTTAHREYAVEGFELQAVDYLLKPISLDRLMTALQKLYSIKDATNVSPMDSQEFTFFRSDRKMIKVNFNDILYIESLGDYNKIHCEKEVLITRETLTIAQEKLPASKFLKTHRSFIVSIPKIDSYTNEHINIQRKCIPISRGYRDAVLEQLNGIR